MLSPILSSFKLEAFLVSRVRTIFGSDDHFLQRTIDPPEGTCTLGSFPFGFVCVLHPVPETVAVRVDNLN